MSNSFMISLHRDKRSVYIMLYNAHTTLDCQTIHNTIFESIQENKAYQESDTSTDTQTHITLDEIQTYKFYVYLDSILLTGGTESTNPYHECFFGTLDSNNSMGLDDTKPIYHLQASDELEYTSTSNDLDSSNTDSKPTHNTQSDNNSTESKTNNTDSNNSLSTLQIFLNSSTLTLLNYSLLDSSLNIKLECNSSESKAIVEKEKAQRDKDSSLMASNDNVASTSMLHPILEDNEIKCPHNGVVQLKSNIGKAFKSQGIPMVLESDLLHSSIIGCANNIAGIPNPCSSVSVILPSARALKKYNNDYPIMQDLVSSGVFSDKGFPLICTPKANSFKINAPKPTQTKNINKETLKANINTSIPVLNIITHYKDLDEFYFTPNIYENKDKDSQSGFYKPNQTLNIKLPKLTKDRDYMDLDSNEILRDLFSQLSNIYNPRLFAYRILTIRIAYSIYEYTLIIPKNMAKFIYNALKDKRSKDELDLGYGDFMDLQRGYVRSMKDSVLDITGAIILAPSGCERLYIKVG